MTKTLKNLTILIITFFTYAAVAQISEEEYNYLNSVSALEETSLVEAETQKELGVTRELLVRPKVEAEIETELEKKKEAELKKKLTLFQFQMEKLLEASQRPTETGIMTKRKTVGYYHDQQTLLTSDSTDTRSFDVTAFPLYENRSTAITPSESSFEMESYLASGTLELYEDIILALPDGTVQIEIQKKETPKIRPIEISASTLTTDSRVNLYFYSLDEKNHIRIDKEEAIVREVTANEQKQEILFLEHPVPNVAPLGVLCLDKNGKYIGQTKKYFRGIDQPGVFIPDNKFITSQQVLN